MLFLGGGTRISLPVLENELALVILINCLIIVGFILLGFQVEVSHALGVGLVLFLFILGLSRLGYGSGM